jgi:hypothetical protein
LKTCTETNKFEVLFVRQEPYWRGTTLRFSGLNSIAFYTLIQKGLIDWTLFSSGILSRFDLYYSRKNKKSDKILITDFLDNSFRKLKQTNKNVSLENNSLKFEQEMKGKFIQDFHLLLLSNSLEKFEQKLSSHFLLYFSKLLPLHFSYLDWLVIKMRPIRKQLIPAFGLNSDYINPKLSVSTQTFVMLLQFLNFAQDLDFEIDYLGGVSYRQVVFKLQDFLKFQNPLVKSNNHYQLEKIKEFFHHLQSGAFLTSFTDISFQSLATIPQVKLEKCLQKKVWLVDELFYHNYPFSFLNFFQKKLTKYELEVGVKFIQTFNSISVEKDFYIEDFFNTYPSTLSNQQRTKIKKSFIELVEIIQDADLIEPNYKIMSNGLFFKTDRLNAEIIF